jgi:pimeloyl-ACP methyl ester carboxylesterase
MQRKLAMPVLGIGGRCNAGEMVGKALAMVAERVGVAVVEGAGHWVSDENPEELSRILLEFFAKA